MVQTDGPDDPTRAGLPPPPEDLRRATRNAFDARAANADVADAVYDSLIDSPAADAAEPHSRELRFAHGETVVRLDVVEYPDHLGTCEVTVHLAPPRSTKIEVRGGDGPFTVDVEDGRAVFEVPTRRLVALVVLPAAPGEHSLQTAWVRL